MSTSKSTNSDNEHTATYKIANIVVNVRLGVDIDVEYIASNFTDVKINLNKFPGIQIRIKSPKSVVLLFKNGKMVITGLKKNNNAQIVIEKVTQRLKEIGIDIPPNPEFETVNIVTSIDFKHLLNLDETSLILPTSVYEPEVFPGIIFRTMKPFKAAFLIFSSGKAVLTGIKNQKHIPPTIKYLGTLLKENNLLQPKSPK